MVFWSKKKTSEKTTKEAAKKTLEEKLSRIDRFQGSLQEYVLLKKEEGYLTGSETIVPMSTGRSIKWVLDSIHSDWFDFKSGGNHVYYEGEQELLSKLIDEGCVGLIRYQRTYNVNSIRCLGTPVKIKKLDDPYR